MLLKKLAAKHRKPVIFTVEIEILGCCSYKYSEVLFLLIFNV